MCKIIKVCTQFMRLKGAGAPTRHSPIKISSLGRHNPAKPSAFSMEDLFFVTSDQGKDIGNTWKHSPALLRIQMNRQNMAQEANESGFRFQDDGELPGANTDVDDDDFISLPQGLQSTPRRVFCSGPTPSPRVAPPFAWPPLPEVLVHTSKRVGDGTDDSATNESRRTCEDIDFSYSRSSDQGEDIVKKPRAVTEPVGFHQAASFALVRPQDHHFTPVYPVQDMPLTYYMPPQTSTTRIDNLVSAARADAPTHKVVESGEDDVPDEFSPAQLPYSGQLFPSPTATHSSPMSEKPGSAPSPRRPAHARRKAAKKSSSARRPSAISTSALAPIALDGARLVPKDDEIATATNTRLRDALDTWYSRLNELYQYKLKHGDCNVPQKQGPLGIWVNKQRMEQKARDDGKKSSMTDGRLEALNRIGFTWAKRKGDHIWNERFGELQAYGRKHGNPNVPTKYPEKPALGRWVSTQRSQYKLYLNGKKSTLNAQKIKKLNKEGFQWSMSQQEDR